MTSQNMQVKCTNADCNAKMMPLKTAQSFGAQKRRQPEYICFPQGDSHILSSLFLNYDAWKRASTMA